jgi:hypothetical protein
MYAYFVCNHFIVFITGKFYVGLNQYPLDHESCTQQFYTDSTDWKVNKTENHFSPYPLYNSFVTKLGIDCHSLPAAAGRRLSLQYADATVG